jgi:hypothetical protein
VNNECQFGGEKRHAFQWTLKFYFEKIEENDYRVHKERSKTVKWKILEARFG